MKKKQFKRLEKLLVHLTDSSIGNGTALHRIKADQRAIADTHSEGGSEILAHLGQVVNLLEMDDQQDALNQIVENTGELNDHLTNIYRGIEQGHEGTRQTTKSIEALSKNLDFWLSKNKDEIGKIAENTREALANWPDFGAFFKQVDAIGRGSALTVEKLVDLHTCLIGIAGFGEEQERQLDRVGDRLVDLHTCLDAWGKFFQEDGGVNANLVSRVGDYLDSIDTQMAPVSHAAGQWSRAQVRSGPGLEEFTAGGTDIPEPSAPEGPDPTTADSWGGKLGEDLPADYRLSDAVRDSEADLLAIQKEAVGRFEDSVMDQWDKSKAKAISTLNRMVIGHTPEGVQIIREEDGTVRPMPHEEESASSIPPRVTIPLSDYERLRGQLLDEISAHNGTKERLTKAAKDHKEALRERDDLRRKQASTLADLGTAIQERQAIKEELAERDSELKLCRSQYAEAVEGLGEWKKRAEEAEGRIAKVDMDYWPSRAHKAEAAANLSAQGWNDTKKTLEETEERLKLALEDLGGHQEGLPQDASMDRFIKWVGNHGWTWIMGHRASINERLDRMEREAAYNRGNNIAPPKTLLPPFDS